MKKSLLIVCDVDCTNQLLIITSQGSVQQ